MITPQWGQFLSPSQIAVVEFLLPQIQLTFPRSSYPSLEQGEGCQFGYFFFLGGSNGLNKYQPHPHLGQCFLVSQAGCSQQALTLLCWAPSRCILHISQAHPVSPHVWSPNGAGDYLGLLCRAPLTR